MNIKSMTFALLSGTALAASIGTAVQAETVAGTTIGNTASVTYTVGGSATTTTSNTVNFLVDKKVNLTVAEIGNTPTYVSIGSIDQVTTFTVTNLTNAIQDFRLEADQTISLPILGTDNYNVANVRIFVDNGDGVYGAGDTATFIDELAPDTTVTVFIVANVPSAAGQNVAIVSLNAIAAAGGSAGGVVGADLVATSALTADSATVVDVVFADAGGTGDLARNGQARAFDAYILSTASVTLAKSVRVLSDPFNLLVNPKAIPGATLQYCIVVANAGPNAASAVITDVIPTGTTFVPGSITVGGLSVAGSCVLGTVEDDDATGADETDLVGGSFNAGTTTVSGVLPTILPLIPLTVAFNVTIN